MKKNRLSAAALLLLMSPLAFGNEPDPPETIIVTATRTAQAVDKTLSSVTVITRRDIERLQAQSVQELLRGIPGVSISSNGGLGKVSSVFMRGTESDHVLVLINGIKVGSATLGTTPFEHIPVAQIERIEVVRGPRSSLYGSEAIGGVIQIFTRTGSGTFKPHLSLGGGSYETYNASAGISGSGERTRLSVNVNSIDSEGFNACNGRPLPNGGGCFTTEPDKDGYDNQSASLRTGYRLNNSFELDAHILRAASENQFDGSFVNESRSLQQILGGSLRFSPLDVWQILLTAGQSLDESDSYKEGAFQSRFDTRRDTISLQNNLTLATDHLLTFGADHQNDQVDGTTSYTIDSRNNIGVFTQYQGIFGKHDIQLSLRWDDNEQFGSRNTYAAGWGYTLNSNLRLTASYGTAFKAPTFNELYFPGFGNPDLSPEESQSFEFGLGGKIIGVNWSFNAYQTDIDDLISFDADTFAPANIDEVRIRGLEMVVGMRPGNWDLNANLTLLDAENRSEGSNQGNILPRRAEQSLRIDADHDFGQLRVGATLLAANRRYDDLANNRKLGGYATVDLRADYNLTRNWRIQARVANLFDEEYETAAFYNQPDRSFYLTLRYQP